MPWFSSRCFSTANVIPVFVLTLVCFSFAGCDKAKELVDKGKEKIDSLQKGNETATAAPVVEAPPAVAPPVQAPVVTEDQILGGIMAKESHQRNDQDLIALGGMSEPYRQRVDVLKLQGASVTEVGLQNLAKLPGLKELYLTQARLSPAAYDAIGQATSLEKLMLDNSDVNDSTLSSLKGLIHLKILNLESTAISDVGLSQLRQCTEIEELQVSNTRIDGSAFKQLKNLAVLKKLGAYGTSIGSAGGPGLRGVKSLEFLSVGKANITDQFLGELKGNTNLIEINLQENNISDVGLKFLSNCVKLEKINLKSTGVTDAALVATFGKAKNLKEVYAPASRITEKGAAALKKRVPDVNVILQ